MVLSALSWEMCVAWCSLCGLLVALSRWAAEQLLKSALCPLRCLPWSCPLTPGDTSQVAVVPRSPGGWQKEGVATLLSHALVSHFTSSCALRFFFPVRALVQITHTQYCVVLLKCIYLVIKSQWSRKFWRKILPAASPDHDPSPQ